MYILSWLHMFKTYQTNYNIISRFEIYIPWRGIALGGHHVFFLYVKFKYIHTYIVHTSFLPYPITLHVQDHAQKLQI